MTEKEKDTDRTEQTDEGEEEPREEGNSIGQKRGRMVTAAILTVVILSVIVVVVAGIFHLASRWLSPCPQDLTVSDPAPVLWNKLEAKRLVDQSLGVPGNLLDQTRFKGIGPEAPKPVKEVAGKESGSGAEGKGAR